MSMKPYRKVLPNGSVEDQPHRQYYIKDVTVLTDYNPMGVGEDASFMATDTMLSAGVNIVYGPKREEYPSERAPEEYLYSAGAII